MYKISILLCILPLVVVVVSKNIGNSKNIVWFPNPNNDGSMIAADLSPNQEVVLGDISDIHYLLYTKENPDTPDELKVGDTEAISNSNYISGAPLKILVHGFGGAYTHDFPWNLGREYLLLEENVNIVLVDWEILADNSNYIAAFENGQIVSQHTADLIEFLISEGVVAREQVHPIGFSLGGQVVGQIGSRVTEKLTRITALDPALPLFDVAHIDNRTDPTDAIFVDVIHTAGNGILGYWEACGTTDWYPNGGRYQPGCGVDITGSCAHSRAPAMFTESVFSDLGFYGRECDSYENFEAGACDSNPTAVMGQHTPSSTAGSFFLKSNSESPFAQGPLE